MTAANKVWTGSMMYDYRYGGVTVITKCKRPEDGGKAMRKLSQSLEGVIVIG